MGTRRFGPFGMEMKTAPPFETAEGWGIPQSLAFQRLCGTYPEYDSQSSK